ncbi:hypothetical protein Q3G72_018421 [Acer saccharum]|nr:hypothetical protein Q3G72_018421 [Acer saccharum]
MGKTKQTNPKEGTSRGTRASQGLGPCVQNKDFVARLRAIKDRTVIFERGIQEGVAELPNDEIAVGDRTDINQRSWKDSASKTKGRKKQKRALEDTQGDEEQDPDFDLPEETAGQEAEGPSDSSVSGQLKWIINALKTSKTVQDKIESTQIRIEQKIDDLARQQYEDRQDQEAEDEDIRADLAGMRTQLGLQAYQRRERRRRPPPPPPPSDSAPGFSAADYVPDDMTPADIERMRRGQGSREQD